MPDVERMTIAMSAELAAAIREAVEAGEYGSTSEVVLEALRKWHRGRDEELRDLTALRAAIKAGFDNGQGIPAEDVFAELKARYAPHA